MSDMKMDGESNKSKRAMLNTTINEDVLVAFKKHCKELGLPMSVVIESFMRQFSTGEFALKIAKNKTSLELEE